MNYFERAQNLIHELLENRRYFHTHAEVGLYMPKAKAYVMKKLSEYGLEPQECGEGVTATLGHGGKVILLRADMDALCQRRNEIVRKRRRNFVVFRRGEW